MSATLGVDIDREIALASSREPVLGLMLDAVATAMIEERCDILEDEIRENMPGFTLTTRFSPGYGDLPLEIQPQVLAALDAARRIGVTCGPALIMTPMKTVTAIVGAGFHARP
jgi:cobalamin-dependent methionine synthase I